MSVNVYDVGQGQLIELRSEHYRLLYDTGPQFRSGFMPLETLWSPGQQFDQVIVSHGDNDHAGVWRRCLTTIWLVSGQLLRVKRCQFQVLPVSVVRHGSVMGLAIDSYGHLLARIRYLRMIVPACWK
ncbi:hypothetical protein HSBAA_25060 [Vreelandella sulfidaeris]|uniref:Metallo-beta-lactamase domain-containing protein n=1 Tax=Vreelandella sulfidaeris TaxID=115553 RepID=A0A455U500_9GAMM|nr:hypothetical protein HSBAA_25060 [Halomonas sulfidaeris]